MSDPDLADGDEFHCWLAWHDGWEPMSVRQIAVLDVFGDYYFAPNWTSDVAFTDRQLPGDGPGEQDLLNFTWPQVPGSVAGLRIWAAFLAPDNMQVLCDPVFVEFGYGN